MISKVITKFARLPALQAIVSFLLPYRTVINVLIHILLFSFSFFYSMLLNNGLKLDEFVLGTTAYTITPLIIIRLLAYGYHDLFRGLWRYVSFADLINIVRAAVISTLLFYLLGCIWGRVCLPEEIYILDFTFCTLFTGGIRFLVRNFREKFAGMTPVSSCRRIYLVGPVDKIQPILKELLSDPNCRFLPVAVVDPDKSEGTPVARVSDIPIMSLRQSLTHSTKTGPVDSVVICWPDSKRGQVDAVVDRMKILNAEFKIIPSVEDILDERVSISSIRRVEIDDLLERPPVNINMAGISEYLEGKAVMVTGGAGSIGSEICRQVAGFGPRLLVIVERSENSLYDFEREIAKTYPELPIAAAISTVNDAAGMAHMMRKHAIDVVFHAAAYKHVPLMEKAPLESAYNNIIGTYNTARAAMKAGVKRFVMISTDKAVNPTNVMGVTKRIAEMVVQSCHNKAGTWFMTVRFGNVLGSSGSVIPIFKKQIEQGQPLTVTHPDIERFFMSISEAVQLVLQAGCMASGGEVFVLDMGQPVKILKLAEKLITLSGKRPYDDIDIVFSGLRPGEKMFEELFNTDEKHVPTKHPRIKAAISTGVNRAVMEEHIDGIKAIIQRKDGPALLQKFFELVPGYQCEELKKTKPLTFPDKLELMPNTQPLKNSPANTGRLAAVEK